MEEFENALDVSQSHLQIFIKRFDGISNSSAQFSSAYNNTIRFYFFQGFVKRLLQLCLFNDVPFICGILLLISELVKRHPNGSHLLLFSQKPPFSSSKTDDDDDEEEHFHDVASEDDQPSQTVPEISSWDHKNLNKSKENHSDHYDIFKRNPLYCGSEYTCVHELIFLKNHSHPTVALFARNLLDVRSRFCSYRCTE